MKMMVLQNFLVISVLLAVGFAKREAQPEEFPFQVSIKTTDKRHICGGAIITSRWILTSSECLGIFRSVLVSYGNVDSNNPIDTISSKRIVHQRENFNGKKNRLALIELSRDVQMSATASPAKLPTEKAVLLNTTKLSGWDVDTKVDFPPNLYVIDRYFLITENCRTVSGTEVELSPDEFCGEEENSLNSLAHPGAIVSKKAILLGLLAQKPMSYITPVIFVKISQHGNWIKEVLGEEAQHITWVDKIPENAAKTNLAASLLFVGISTMFLRYL